MKAKELSHEEFLSLIDGSKSFSRLAKLFTVVLLAALIPAVTIYLSGWINDPLILILFGLSGLATLIGGRAKILAFLEGLDLVVHLVAVDMGRWEDKYFAVVGNYAKYDPHVEDDVRRVARLKAVSTNQAGWQVFLFTGRTQGW